MKKCKNYAAFIKALADRKDCEVTMPDTGFGNLHNIRRNLAARSIPFVETPAPGGATFTVKFK